MTPWTVACQAPLSTGFPRQECWNGLPFPSPGDLPDSGIESVSPALAGGFFTTEPPGFLVLFCFLHKLKVSGNPAFFLMSRVFLIKTCTFF